METITVKIKPLVSRKTIVKEIRDLLKNRRHVFFKMYHNSRKQQLVINAEVDLYFIENQDMESFTKSIKTYANKYIKNLIPQPGSQMHDTINDLYNKIINFNTK